MNPRLLRPTRRRPRVPGAPAVVSALDANPVAWAPPASDGGSPILLYRVYVNGVLFETVDAPGTSSVDSVAAGAVVQVSAVNAAGEGPKSGSVVAT